MSHFLYKLIPPRPTFAQDMSEDEAATMEGHARYWQALVDQGHALVFGPVLEPAGTWGLAVVEAADEASVRAMGDADPAVVGGIASFEVHAMPATVTRP